MNGLSIKATGVRVILVVVHEGRQTATEVKDAATEMEELAAAASLDVLATHVVKVRQSRPATYIGTGTVEKIAELAEKCAAQQIIINRDLSMTQVRNLEQITHHSVIDRTELILTIFSQRATSHEGKLQVELAQCRRQMGRLAGLWTHLERQQGGFGLRGGPGEKQMELDRRMLAVKVQRLEKQIEKMAARHLSARSRRRKNGTMMASLVGYTNAGKSSLFNILTGLSLSTGNRLFDTLSSTTRRVCFADRQCFVLSDTVGFIRHLPHDLIAGFRATLQDTANSDVLILVVDATCPDWRQRLDLVNQVLEDIGAGEKYRIIVFNKIDLTDLPAKVIRSECDRMSTVYLSCQKKEGIDLLRQEIQSSLVAHAVGLLSS